MKRKTRHPVLRGMIWVGGIAGLLLSLSIGLELFVLQAHGTIAITTLLLALYLAAWSYVLGLAGVALLSVWWMVGRLGWKASPAPIDDVSIEPRTRSLRKGAWQSGHGKVVGGETKVA
jgi:hypothetical protein